jgi:hypothetical protein
MPNWPAVKLTDAVVGVDIHTTAARLQQTGLSPLGAMQVLRGEPVTLVADRNIIAKIVTVAVSREIK